MKTILVVEDEKIFQELVSSALKDSGYNVLSAENGKIALDLVSKNDVDLILLDVMMPEMSGTVFVYELKNRLNKDIPIIILTNLQTVSFQDFIPTVLIKSNTSLEQIVAAVDKSLGVIR